MISDDGGDDDDDDDIKADDHGEQTLLLIDGYDTWDGSKCRFNRHVEGDVSSLKCKNHKNTKVVNQSKQKTLAFKLLFWRGRLALFFWLLVCSHVVP